MWEVVDEWWGEVLRCCGRVVGSYKGLEVVNNRRTGVLRGWRKTGWWEFSRDRVCGKL